MLTRVSSRIIIQLEDQLEGGQKCQKCRAPVHTLLTVPAAIHFAWCRFAYVIVVVIVIRVLRQLMHSRVTR